MFSTESITLMHKLTQQYSVYQIRKQHLKVPIFNPHIDIQ